MSSTAETKYETLPQSEAFIDNADEEGHTIAHPSQRPQRKIGFVLLQAIIILFASLGIIDIARIAVLQPWTPPNPPIISTTLTSSGFLQTPHQRSCRCGASVQEAKANNCMYDSMAAAWLPPHCIDFKLLREWEKAGDGPNGEWEYFADQHRETQLTLEEVAHLPERDDMQNAFFVSMAWHVKHCAFAWRKEYRSAATGVTVDRRSSGLHHIAHCEMMFLKRNALSDLVTRVGVVMDADEGDDELE